MGDGTIRHFFGRPKLASNIYDDDCDADRGRMDVLFDVPVLLLTKLTDNGLLLESLSLKKFSLELFQNNISHSLDDGI